MNVKLSRRCLFFSLVIIGSYASGLAAQQVDGLLSPTPVGATTMLSVEIAVPAGQLLAGLRWYNNDATRAFPKLLLLEADAGTPPDLSETGMILREVTGASLAWGTFDLEQPVQSSTGSIHAVFLFPDGAEMTAEGENGGPGIGYRHAPSTKASYLSPDGLEWVRLSLVNELAVDPVFASAKAESGAPTLASLRDAIDPAELPREKASNRVAATRLLSARPNPFNPSTQIRFELASQAEVSLSIYDVRGRRVNTIELGHQAAGEHVARWDGRDARGAEASSGVYWIQLHAGEQRDQLRVTLLK